MKDDQFIATSTTTTTTIVDHPLSGPLDLPEILAIVARWLREDRASLISSLCVSKGFYHAFVPHVWYSLALGWPQLIPLDVVTAHARYVQTLSFKSILPYEYKNMYFPRLNHLSLGTLVGPEWTLDAYSAIVRAHKTTVESLTLGITLDFISDDEFWRCVGDIQTLRRLHMATINVEGEERARIFWYLCENRLTRLEIERGAILNTKSSNAAMAVAGPEAWSLLERVNASFVQFDGPSFDQLVDLLGRSQNLRSLIWSTLSTFSSSSLGQPLSLAPLAQLLSDSPSGLWPFLTVLHLTESHLSDAQLAATLKSLSIGLKDLHIQGSEVGPQSMQTLLSRHAATMTYLTIHECDLFTSAMMIEVLCSCPRLFSVSGNGLLASDIAKSTRPWVCCSQLQEWHLVVYCDLEGLENLVYRKLSTLGKLKVMDLNHRLGQIGLRPHREEDGSRLFYFRRLQIKRD